MLDRRFLAPHAIARWAADTPDTVALQHVNGGSLTYRQLLDETLRWAGAYRRLGVGAGDHVAIMIPHGLTVPKAWMGLGWLRAVEVPLNTAYVGGLLRYALDLAEVTMMVIGAEYVDRLAAVAAELPALKTVVVVEGSPPETDAPFRIVSQADFLAGVRPASDILEAGGGPDYRDIAAILFTSGTTGPSKAVLSPWALIVQMCSWFPEDALAPGEGMYCAFPMFHNSGKSGFNLCMVRGGRFVLRDRFSAAHFWDDVRATNCVLGTTVGPMTALLYAQPPRPDDADNPLRSILLGPMIPEMADFERRFGVKVATCYGQTEIGAPVVTPTWDHGPWAGCGRPRIDYPWTEVQVVNEHDEPLGVGEVGELVVRTREPWALNAGYYRMPDKTAEAWRNGWFHTGDAFRFDEDGWYYYVDRMKDAIRRRGENISSFEVENFVLEHPGVADVAAVGVPAEHGEDEVFVMVVAKEQADFDPADLVEFLGPRMPRFMIPRYVEVVADLPRNETSMRVRKDEIRRRGVTDATWDRESAAAGRETAAWPRPV
jgi:crotonobetaine/carnitine-CoA ligase